MFNDHDGYGFSIKDGKADRAIIIRPSGLGKIPDDATHIVWYNR